MPVSPGIRTPSWNQAIVSGVLPSTMKLRVAIVPAHSVTSIGWAVIVGAVRTVRVAGPAVTVSQVFDTDTV